jgi:hypothetical protein
MFGVVLHLETFSTLAFRMHRLALACTTSYDSAHEDGRA